MHEYIDDIRYLEDELLALFVVKVIYAFKHLEINIKKLLSSAYRDKTVSKRMDWNRLHDYLSLKGISVKQIKSYKEVDELRQLNNSIKHSSEFDSAITSIIEFKDKKVLLYTDMEIFYDRIKEHPNIFLQNLSYEISKNLYDFPDEKIQHLAEETALRMDKHHAIKFFEKLMKLYT